MQRQARLGVPGSSQHIFHVIGLGVEAIKIFRGPEDREESLTRLGIL